MNKFFSILKYNLLNDYKILGLSKKNNIKKIIIYILIFYFAVAGFIYYSFNGLSVMLKQQNLLFLALLIGTGIEMLYCTVTNIHKASSYLFSFKDYDLLTSMPIPKNIILMSKLSSLYIDNLVFALFIMIPSFLYYGINNNSTFIFYLYSIIFLLLLPLLSVSIGATFSFLLGKIASKFKKSNFILSLLSVGLVVLYVKFVQSFMRIEDSVILTTISKQSDLLKNNFIIGHMFMAFEETNFISFLIISLICIFPFVVLVFVFQNYFTQINASFSEVYTTKNYKMKPMKSSTPVFSLIKKELIHYFTSYMYFLNTFIPLVFMTIFTLGYVFTGNDFVKELIGANFPVQYISPIFTIVYCAFITMVSILSCSISLEGKNFWIIKNLPIQTSTILHSKIFFNLIIILPVLYINIFIISFALSLKPLEILMIFLISTLYTKLISNLYLFINLLFPKMIWTSPTKVLKQGLSVFVSGIIGILCLLIICLTLYFLLQDLFLAYIVIFLELLISNIISNNILFSKGKILFSKIQ